MVPVDHVALCVALAAVTPLTDPNVVVLHVTASPLPTFNDLFSSLARYGYVAKQDEYLVWRRRLEQHVMEAHDNALFPLLHFVLDDLPTSTKAPALDDSNTVALLQQYQVRPHMTVTDELVGKYLAWLVGAGFLPPPSAPSPSRVLPSLGNGAIKAAGRSGM